MKTHYDFQKKPELGCLTYLGSAFIGIAALTWLGRNAAADDPRRGRFAAKSVKSLIGQTSLLFKFARGERLS